MKRIVLVLGIVTIVVGLFAAFGFKGKKILPATSPASSNSSASVADPLTDATIYTDPGYGYTIKIPKGLKTEPQQYYTLFSPSDQPPGPGPVNFLYISVVPVHLAGADSGVIYNYNANAYQKLFDINNVGKSVNLADERSGQEEWYTYTLVAIEDIDGKKVKHFQNNNPWEFPKGTTEDRYIVDTGSEKYILGYYTGGNVTQGTIDPRTAYSIIKSFKVKGN